MSITKHEPIKSFTLRQGKITKGQNRALIDLLPIYGIEYNQSPLDLTQKFNRISPKIIEIGFGMGDAAIEMALNNPDKDYLGIEVHSPGVGSLLLKIKALNLLNLKIIHYDAIKVLNYMIIDNSISGFHIFFPDPWPKTRHHKRRIIQTSLINLLCKKLTSGGYIHLATDWEEYAKWMLEICNQQTQLVNTALTKDFILRPSYRPQTKFERRGLNLGYKVWDLLFVKADISNFNKAK